VTDEWAGNEEWSGERRQGIGDRRATNESTNNIVYIGRSWFRMEREMANAPANEIEDDDQDQDENDWDDEEEHRLAAAHGPAMASGVDSADLPLLQAPIGVGRPLGSTLALSRTRLLVFSAAAFGAGLLISAGVLSIGGRVSPAAATVPAQQPAQPERTATPPTIEATTPTTTPEAAPPPVAATPPVVTSLPSQDSQLVEAVESSRHPIVEGRTVRKAVEPRPRPVRAPAASPPGESAAPDPFSATQPPKLDTKTDPNAPGRWVDPFAQ